MQYFKASSSVRLFFVVGGFGDLGRDCTDRISTGALAVVFASEFSRIGGRDRLSPWDDYYSAGCCAKRTDYRFKLSPHARPKMSIRPKKFQQRCGCGYRFAGLFDFQ